MPSARKESPDLDPNVTYGSNPKTARRRQGGGGWATAPAGRSPPWRDVPERPGQSVCLPRTAVPHSPYGPLVGGLARKVQF